MRRLITWSRLPAIVCVLFFVGCCVAFIVRSRQASIMERRTPPQAEAQAKAYVDLLRTNQFDRIERDFEPSLAGEGTENQLVVMASLFPAQDPTSIKVVAVESHQNEDSADLRITLEYEFPGKWLLASLVTRSRDGTQTIAKFHVDEIPDSLEHGNRLTLAGKGFEQYAILSMLVIDLGLTFYALILCARTRLSKRNWFWPIVCLFGVGRFVVNWTTGEASFTSLWIGLPPAGASSTFFGPWTVYAAAPLGAILFLLLHSHLTHHPHRPDPQPIP